MKRAWVLVLGAGLLVGCAGQSGTTVKTPAGPVKADYFEVNKNGQTYVFGDVKSMQAFLKDGNAGPTVTEIYGSKLVSFQATGEQGRLATEYEKQHK